MAMKLNLMNGNVSNGLGTKLKEFPLPTQTYLKKIIQMNSWTYLRLNDK